MSHSDFVPSLKFNRLVPIPELTQRLTPPSSKYPQAASLDTSDGMMSAPSIGRLIQKKGQSLPQNARRGTDGDPTGDPTDNGHNYL